MNTRLYEVIAKLAHRGQKYGRDGDYFKDHVSKVVAILEARNATRLEVKAGYLHDVVEDSELTIADLAGLGVEPEVLRVVEILTKLEGEVYPDYIARISKSYFATQVKLADLTANLSAEPVPERLRIRYTEAIKFLTREKHDKHSPFR